MQLTARESVARAQHTRNRVRARASECGNTHALLSSEIASSIRRRMKSMCDDDDGNVSSRGTDGPTPSRAIETRACRFAKSYALGPSSRSAADVHVAVFDFSPFKTAATRSSVHTNARETCCEAASTQSLSGALRMSRTPSSRTNTRMIAEQPLPPGSAKPPLRTNSRVSSSPNPFLKMSKTRRASGDASRPIREREVRAPTLPPSSLSNELRELRRARAVVCA